MGLLLRRYQPSSHLLTGALTPSLALDGTTASDPGPDTTAEPPPDPPDPGPGVLRRAARLLLWTVLGLLVVRETTEVLQTLNLRTRRVVSHWWSDLDRRSRSDTRRAEIGLLASLIGRRRR
jgi:hypothetical protein